MSVVRLPSGKFRVQVRRSNLQFDRTFDTEAEAKEVKKNLLRAPEVQAEGLTLANLCDMYHRSIVFSQKAIQTQATEKTRIKPVLVELGNYGISALAQETRLIYEYIDKRSSATSEKTGKRLSSSSVRLEVAALSAVIAFAKKRQLVRENFVSGISRPVTKKRKRRVTNQEQGALQRFARIDDPAIAKAARFLLLIRHLGCRPGELSALLICDLNLACSELTFRETKNGLDRRIHITRDAAELLHLQLADAEDAAIYVFGTWSRYRKAWQPYNYSYGVKRLREVGAVPPDYVAHAGRREFVSRAIEASVPYGTIKKQTGHKSTQALEIYDEGLSTAPEIRAVFDTLAEKVRDENLLGTLEGMCTTDEQRKKIAQILGKDAWVSPFTTK